MYKAEFIHVRLVRLLRYATYFVFLCAGLPLSMQRAGSGPGAIGDMPLLAWTACYLVFGLVYWLLTNQMGARLNGATRVAVLAEKRVIICDTVPEVLKFDHPFIHTFFLGERGLRALGDLAPKGMHHGKP